MNCTIRLIVAALLPLTLLPGTSAAWWDCGHHVIAILAYNELSPDQRKELIAILRQHPRFAEDFAVPEGTTDKERWYIGQAGTWPDIARGLGDEWNRPTWHYELGHTMVIGQQDDVDVRARPGPLPDDATMSTGDLYASQATALCRNILSDESQPADQRALAVAWLAHLVADMHQPCHAGSLYAANVFPDGDRGANAVRVQQERNLHAFWDSLLGRRYDRTYINRKVAAISGNARLVQQAKQEASELNPHVWLQESRETALRAVYTDEVLNPIQAVHRKLAPKMKRIDLSDEYCREAGRVAEAQAARAAHRLAAIWRQALSEAAGSTVADAAPDSK